MCNVVALGCPRETGNTRRSSQPDSSGQRGSIQSPTGCTRTHVQFTESLQMTEVSHGFRAKSHHWILPFHSARNSALFIFPNKPSIWQRIKIEPLDQTRHSLLTAHPHVGNMMLNRVLYVCATLEGMGMSLGCLAVHDLIKHLIGGIYTTPWHTISHGPTMTLHFLYHLLSQLAWCAQ